MCVFILDSSHHRTKTGYIGHVTTMSHTEVMEGSLSTQLSPLLNCSFLLGDLFRYIPCIQDNAWILSSSLSRFPPNGNKTKNNISGSPRPTLSSSTIPAGSALGRDGHHRVHTYEIQGTGLCGVDRAVSSSPTHPGCASARTTEPWDGKLLHLLCGYRLWRHLQIMA